MRTIQEAMVAINAALQGTALGNFYSERALIKKEGRKAYRWLGGLIQVANGDEPLQGYAFHKGGRGELQFNIGFEEGKYFRFGLGYSLEADRNLPEPVNALLPSIQRFNAVLAEFPELSRLRMWKYEHKVRSPDRLVAPIPISEVKAGTFLFIGDRIEVPKEGLSDEIIQRATKVLLALFPLYKRVEDGSEIDQVYRVARICWNTLMWQGPSGRAGKSSHPKTFEGANGFGHEEWLFNHSTLLGGWKYGFIQALNRSHDKYAGKPIKLLLYTWNSTTKSRYWVAAIDNAQVLTRSQAERAQEKYDKNRWVEDMSRQLEQKGLDGETLDVEDPIELLNFRFRPEDQRLFDPPIRFPKGILPSLRYGNFQSLPASQAAIVGSEKQIGELAEQNIGKLKAKRRTYADEVEVDLVQKQWQAQLKKTLANNLPGVKVTVETVVDGHRLDLLLQRDDVKVFVELKTKSVVKQVIREALSQLLEYTYWPGGIERCRAMLIVGAGKASDADIAYLQDLRRRFGMNVHYLQYQEGAIVGIADWLKTICDAKPDSVVALA